MVSMVPDPVPLVYLVEVGSQNYLISFRFSDGHAAYWTCRVIIGFKVVWTIKGCVEYLKPQIDSAVRNDTNVYHLWMEIWENNISTTLNFYQ